MNKAAEEIFEQLKHYFMGEASEPYSDKVLTLAYEPMNVGEIENPDTFGYVKGSCGDEMTIFLRIKDGRIYDAKFLTDGCGATLACGSTVTELAKGKTIWEAKKIHPQGIVDYLGGLPASHLHCAFLAVRALRKALDNLNSREEINNVSYSF